MNFQCGCSCPRSGLDSHGDPGLLLWPEDGGNSRVFLCLTPPGSSDSCCPDQDTQVSLGMSYLVDHRLRFLLILSPLEIAPVEAFETPLDLRLASVPETCPCDHN